MMAKTKVKSRKMLCWSILVMCAFSICLVDAQESKTLIFRKSICTGMGDRIGFILSLSALGQVYNATVKMEWCVDPMRAGEGNPLHFKFIPKWRGWKYPLQKVISALNFPNNIQLVEGAPPVGENDLVVWDRGEQIPVQASIMMPTLAGKLWLVDGMRQISSEKFKAAYYSVAEEMQPSRKAVEAMDTLEPYDVILHIRSPDRNTHTIHRDERPSSFCTGIVAEQLLSAGLRILTMSNRKSWAFHVLGDLQNHPNVTMLPKASAWFTMAIFVGHRHAGILQHAAEGWSAYSTVPAVAHSVPLLNTFLDKSNHRLHQWAAMGALPEGLMHCGEAEKFVSLVASRVLHSELHSRTN